MLAGDALAPFGAIAVCIAAALLASQASVERIFSAANWACENRERLGLHKLAKEVKLKLNVMALSKH